MVRSPCTTGASADSSQPFAHSLGTCASRERRQLTVGFGRREAAFEHLVIVLLEGSPPGMSSRELLRREPFIQLNCIFRRSMITSLSPMRTPSSSIHGFLPFGPLRGFAS